MLPLVLLCATGTRAAVFAALDGAVDAGWDGAAEGLAVAPGGDAVAVTGGGDCRLLVRGPAGVLADAGACLPDADAAVAQALWADFDGDGAAELFVVRPESFDAVVRLNGTAVEDATAAFGLPTAGVRHTLCAAPIDVNQDGHADLVLGTESNQSDRLLVFDPATGRFDDRTSSYGFGMSRGALAIAVADVNNDGWSDVFVARESPDSSLYVFWVPSERFEDRMAMSGLTIESTTGGVAFGDWNGDGAVDVYLSFVDGSNKCFTNQGASTFEEELGFAGSFLPDSHTSLWLDANLDGRLDLLVSVQTGAAPLFEQAANDAFVQSDSGLVGEAMLSLAALDWDDDGDLDVLASGASGLTLYENLSMAPTLGVVMARLGPWPQAGVVVQLEDMDGNVLGSRMPGGVYAPLSQSSHDARFFVEPGQYRVRAIETTAVVAASAGSLTEVALDLASQPNTPSWSQSGALDPSQSQSQSETPQPSVSMSASVELDGLDRVQHQLFQQVCGDAIEQWCDGEGNPFDKANCNVCVSAGTDEWKVAKTTVVKELAEMLNEVVDDETFLTRQSTREWLLELLRLLVIQYETLDQFDEHSQGLRTLVVGSPDILSWTVLHDGCELVRELSDQAVSSGLRSHAASNLIASHELIVNEIETVTSGNPPPYLSNCETVYDVVDKLARGVTWYLVPEEPRVVLTTDTLLVLIDKDYVERMSGRQIAVEDVTLTFPENVRFRWGGNGPLRTVDLVFYLYQENPHVRVPVESRVIGIWLSHENKPVSIKNSGRSRLEITFPNADPLSHEWQAHDECTLERLQETCVVWTPECSCWRDDDPVTTNMDVVLECGVRMRDDTSDDGAPLPTLFAFKHELELQSSGLCQDRSSAFYSQYESFFMVLAIIYSILAAGGVVLVLIMGYANALLFANTVTRPAGYVTLASSVVFRASYYIMAAAKTYADADATGRFLVLSAPFFLVTLCTMMAISVWATMVGTLADQLTLVRRLRVYMRVLYGLFVVDITVSIVIAGSRSGTPLELGLFGSSLGILVFVVAAQVAFMVGGPRLMNKAQDVASISTNDMRPVRKFHSLIQSALMVYFIYALVWVYAMRTFNKLLDYSIFLHMMFLGLEFACTAILLRATAKFPLSSAQPTPAQYRAVELMQRRGEVVANALLRDD